MAVLSVPLCITERVCVIRVPRFGNLGLVERTPEGLRSSGDGDLHLGSLARQASLGFGHRTGRSGIPMDLGGSW